MAHISRTAHLLTLLKKKKACGCTKRHVVVKNGTRSLQMYVTPHLSLCQDSCEIFFSVFQPGDFEKAAIQPPGELFLRAVVFLRGD